MRKIPLAKLPEHIKHSEGFNGSSVHGKLYRDEYNVYSYNTLIASFKHGVLLWFDDTSYSSTTSKLQHLIRANYTINELTLHAAKSHKVHIKES